MNRPAYILLGSNIEPRKNIPIAIRLLEAQFGKIKISKIYESPPIKYKEHSNYYNALVKVMTSKSPENIKYDCLRLIEDQMGRKRTEDKYSPRIIDLDLIAIGDDIINNNELVLPDPEILNYAHVAVPLMDIEPDWVHPITHESIKEIVTRLTNDVTKLLLEEVSIE